MFLNNFYMFNRSKEFTFINLKLYINMNINYILRNLK